MQNRGTISTVLSAAQSLPLSIISITSKCLGRGQRCNRRRHQWNVGSVALMGGLSSCCSYVLWLNAQDLQKNVKHKQSTDLAILQHQWLHQWPQWQDSSSELHVENLHCLLFFFFFSTPINFVSGSQEAADYPSMHQSGRKVITGFQTTVQTSIHTSR